MELRVDEILNYPYLDRSIECQKSMVALGRNVLFKCPALLKKRLEKENGHFFDDALYAQVQWLVRCVKRREYVCWNCLLYSPSTAILQVMPNADLPSVLENTSCHEQTEEHMEATLRLQMFIMANFRTANQVIDKTRLNLVAKTNREILKRLINAVCCTVVQKHSRGDGKYTHTRVEVEDCARFLALLKECDEVNVELVEGAAEILRRQPRIVNDLVDAITRVVKMAIRNETHQSTYVSVILSEHTALQGGRSQISTVLRYVKQGKVCERFVGFANVIGDNSNKDITKLIANTIEQYGISDRFLALSVDGRVLPKPALPNLINSVRATYTFSYFVPWHSHGFGNTLLQSLSDNDQFRLFLQKLEAVETFFESSKHREFLELALISQDPEIRTNKWYNSVPFIVVVAKYRSCFVKFFDGILQNCKYYKADVVTKAIAFRKFLQEILTVFLLHTFYALFSDYFDAASNFVTEVPNEVQIAPYAFDQPSVNARGVFDNPKISAFKEHVGTLAFQNVWNAVISELEKEGRNSPLASQSESISAVFFSELFRVMLRQLFTDVGTRCMHMNKLKFCDMLNCSSDGKFFFSSDLMYALMTEHGPFFKERDIRCEVAALNINREFQASIQKNVHRSVYHTMEFFADLNLRTVFPQLYKLAEFTLTLPYLPADPENGKSKLKDIDKCSYFPEKNGIPSGEASFLCVETELLRELRNSPHFYDDVLSRFYEVNKSLLLIQVSTSV